MLSRAWKPALVAAAVSAPSYYLYKSTYGRDDSFEIVVKVAGADGRPERQKMVLPLQSMKQINARLHEHETSRTWSRPGVVWRSTTSFLSSNDPIEDANAAQIVQKDPNSPGDYLFYAVMDGHGGPNTSKLLSHTLISAVARELATLTQPEDASNLAKRAASLIWANKAPIETDPLSISKAMQTAFTRLDDEILKMPVQYLASKMDAASRDKDLVPDLREDEVALLALRTAVSGSCALLTLFDTDKRDLYVACVGDSRAVAGIRESGDVWGVDVLTQDQTGRNPEEVARIKSEHPADEADNLIRNGRVFGGLEPSRAFGDAKYKWPPQLQQILNDTIAPIGTRPNMLRLLQTPPYVIARPAVTHRKLSLPSDPQTGKEMKFVVMATDGLWDMLSSEEVVSLVAGHFAGLQGAVPKAELEKRVPTSISSPTVEGKAKTRRTAEGAWVFMDDNVSTHLIRNAFGGADEEKLRHILSIPSPYSRRYRDDITVTVVWWDGEEGEQSIKSKL
ncbi:phosphatase 2C-like domain-containing protein [Schizophyllum amplum]|uniref:Phosphatase 2C-like domain-containing protein n=1 Tax=Schizophyllum amplum TaxID=97359 RepID=A0A550CTS9_9AGAR|nr:phosphatase 2C-like domain-containing protein [Auriculariopsis ampla]